MQHTVTQILAEATTVAEATPKILRALGECMGWDVGALWRVDRDAGVLRCAEVWHKPSKEVPEFESASRERTFLAGVGLPGKVWLSRTRSRQSGKSRDICWVHHMAVTCRVFVRWSASGTAR